MLIKRIYPTRAQRKVLKMLNLGSALELLKDGSYVISHSGETINKLLVGALDSAGWLDHHGVMRVLSGAGADMMKDRNHLVTIRLKGASSYAVRQRVRT